MAGSARRVRAAVLIAAGGALLAPHALAAQCVGEACRAPARSTAASPSWSGELQVVGVNAALGAVTAGLLSKARGGSFTAAFGRGALGGVGVYAGKRVTTAGFRTAGLLGREIAAVGASVVRNAADGRGSFDRLVLPAGLARVYIDRTASSRVRVAADLSAMVATAYAATRPELRFDLAGSVSAGLPVFLAEDGFQGAGWDGRHAAGVIWLRETVARRDGGSVRSEVLAHETIHAAQNDFSFIVWSLPAEERFRRRMLGPISRYVDLGLQVPALGVVSFLADYDRRPWEREAHFLASTGR